MATWNIKKGFDVQHLLLSMPGGVFIFATND